MRVLLLCLTFFFLSCAKKPLSAEQSSALDSNVSTSINQTIENLLGKDNSQIVNESKTLTLVYQNNAEPNQLTRYIVLEQDSGAIIAKGSFRAGYVKWNSDNSLEIFDVPGIIPKEKKQSDYIKIVNLPTQKK